MQCRDLRKKKKKIQPLFCIYICDILRRVGDGQGGLACCGSWGRKESDTTERLNWAELNWMANMILSYQGSPNESYCIGQESNPCQLLGRQLCSPLYHQYCTFLSTSPKTLSLRFNLAPVHRDWDFGITTCFFGGSDSKESACQSKTCKRHGFDPWVGKISWSRKWQSTTAFLPGKSHGFRNLVDCSPWGCKELAMTACMQLIY